MRLLLLSLLFMSGAIYAQTPTELINDNFENGSSNWTLGTTGDSWVVDTNYQGLIMDMGFTQISIFPNSPEQPAAFTNAPRSKYLHIQDAMLCSLMGYCNATYSTTGTSYATLAQPLDLANYQSTTVSYSYFIEGHVDSAYAHLEYSVDSITWVEVGSKMYNKSTWETTSVAIPALDGISTAYIRIKWKNLGYSDTNLGIGVDEFKITAIETNSTYISNVAIDQPSFCSETATPVNITFKSNGVFDPGNIFTTYISDANGSFASAQSIGTLSSTANGTLTIQGNLPALTAANYKLKVVSSSPVLEDTLVSALIIDASPQLTISSDQTINVGESVTLTASGADTYTWSPSAELNSATGGSVIATPSATTTYTVTGKGTNGCTSTAAVIITVSTVGLTNMDLEKIAIYPNPSSDNFTVQSLDNKTIDAIEVFTVDGKKVNQFHFQNNVLEITQAGVYIVKLTIDNQLHIISLIKE